MKKQNLQDERVVTQRRKINSEAYGILMIVLLVSISIQAFLLNAPFEQYAVEFICFFGISIYMIVRHMMLGLNLYGEGPRAKANSLVNSLVTGVIATAIHGVLNYTRYSEHYKDNIGLFILGLAVFFISSTISVFIVLSFVSYLNKKRQAKIQKRLEEDEKNE